MVFDPGHPTHKSDVTWYWAHAGALVLPFYSRFSSRNWCSKEGSPDGLGEDPAQPRPYYKGTQIGTFNGLYGCNTAGEWANGKALLAAGAFDEAGCCAPPPPPCNCPPVINPVNRRLWFRVQNPFSCTPAAGLEFPMDTTDCGLWAGELIWNGYKWCGRLTYDAGSQVFRFFFRGMSNTLTPCSNPPTFKQPTIVQDEPLIMSCSFRPIWVDPCPTTFVIVTRITEVQGD